MNEYFRKVQYHETDKMGITHHSNYIKWMEEARIWFLDQIGCSYAKMEADGVSSPVTAVSCNYKTPTTFGDEVAVKVHVLEYTGVRLVIGYEMTNTATEQTVAQCKSEHCFFNSAGRPIALRRKFPAYDQLFKELLEESQF